jgi:hypothetical protein
MKTCIILFSHAESEKKQQILNRTLSSLKLLNLPIILVSHAPVSIDNQINSDYVIYDKNNLLITETEFFNEDIPLTEANFNTQYFFGSISTRCYLHKKTYTPAVINLYIDGFSFANKLGFDYGILWEYDFELTKDTSIKISKILSEVVTEYQDGFFITCQISGINCIQAVPAIFPIKKFNDYIPKKILETPKDVIDETKMMLSEEWIYHFYKTLENPLTYPFDIYSNIIESEMSNQVSSGVESPLFWGLNSGIFIDKNDKSNWVCSVFNSSPKTINYSYELFFNGEVIDSFSDIVYPNYWRYDFISKNISEEILQTNKSLIVKEHIKYDDVNEVYEYEINKHNINSISKGKVFFVLS